MRKQRRPAARNLPEPVLNEVQQEPPPEPIPTPPVEVSVVGQVRTQDLPTRTTSMRSIPVLGVETLAGADPRRASVTLYARVGTDEDPLTGFYVGPDRQMVADGQAAYFDAGHVVRLRTAERLYVRTGDDTLTTACQLTVIQEQWAD